MVSALVVWRAVSKETLDFEGITSPDEKGFVNVASPDGCISALFYVRDLDNYFSPIPRLILGHLFLTSGGDVVCDTMPRISTPFTARMLVRNGLVDYSSDPSTFRSRSIVQWTAYSTVLLDC